MHNIGTNMRQRRVVDRQHVQRQSGGKKKWDLRLQIGHAPVRVHFGVPDPLYKDEESGAELPYVPHDQHYVKRARGGKGSGFICAKDKCVVCAYANPQAYGLDLEPDLGLAKCHPKLAFGVVGWVEEWCHDVQYERDDKQGVYHRRELCKGKTCEFCKGGFPKVFGKRFYYPFSGGTWKYHIETVHELAERQCKCGGSIYVPYYYCPKCENILEDVLQTCVCGSTNVEINLEVGDAGCKDCNRSWKAYAGDDEDLMKKIENPLLCPHCGAKDVLPMPKHVCTTEGCEAQPYSVFDCQLALRKEGEGEKQKIVVPSWKIQEPDPRLFDIKFQGDDEWTREHSDIINRLLDPSKYFQPDPPEQVAQSIGVINPFGNAPVSRQTVVYPRNNRVVEEEVVPENEPSEDQVAEE